ncbi:MAG: TonB-dependent receptor, partial [Prevotella sp.]|nr:TonB-dependent receptor [Prevotella sp.]
HKGNVFVMWGHRFSDTYRLGVGVYGRMSSKRCYQTDGNGKGYQTWRITTSHDIGKSKHCDYRLELGIDNIFDYVDRTPHGLHLGTTTPGRTVYATFSIKFHKGNKISNKFKSNNYQKQNTNEED